MENGLTARYAFTDDQTQGDFVARNRFSATNIRNFVLWLCALLAVAVATFFAVGFLLDIAGVTAPPEPETPRAD